jgi:hypothetical protein
MRAYSTIPLSGRSSLVRRYLNSVIQWFDDVQVLQPQLELRAWRDRGRQGGGGGLRPAGHPPEDHAAQLPRLPRQDPEGGLPRDSRQRGRSPGEGSGTVVVSRVADPHSFHPDPAF